MKILNENTEVAQGAEAALAAALTQLENRLGYAFADRSLLKQALTHKSYANENPNSGPDNQRLEYLGDAVVGLVVAQALMAALPSAPEGQLTPKRAELVRASSLVKLARELDLGETLLLGKGEEQNNGRDRPSNLADAMEAIMGAVHLDGGYPAAQRSLLQVLAQTLQATVESTDPTDVKTALQEHLQSHNLPTPVYIVVSEEGPDHAKVFEVEIASSGQCLARGRGRTKKDAEKNAARIALQTIKDRQ